MEVHAAPAVGKRMWSYLRAIFFMARKGFLSNKRKLLLGVHLLMNKRRRNKQAVSRTVAALLSHHGHGHALRRREYEFSCTNSPDPAASSGSSKRHLAYFPCLGAVAEEEDDYHRYGGSHLESPASLARIEYYAAAAAAPEEEEYSCCASPALMMAGAASVRVSNYSSEDDEGVAGGGAAVDDEAEEFIRRFYEQLRRQNTVAMLPYTQDCAA
ncbi:hypothetical protein HU200_009434 [Digitaria exilis]|uniref:Uncharacterized protein n=1 Tax=Digitaria exilis TaxID=1010633 RepID=A0A835FKS8_9POAL|nr:hypothetical protein HU200_009434 [Digitaria exilis]